MWLVGASVDSVARTSVLTPYPLLDYYTIFGGITQSKPAFSCNNAACFTLHPFPFFDTIGANSIVLKTVLIN